MSNFLSFRFLYFMIVVWIASEIVSGIHYFILKYIKKDKYIEGVKFKFLNIWVDNYFKNKFSSCKKEGE